ncbi:hypothetical protein SAMN05216486_11031 [bacterium JGI 053]|nr:hypothetical protein SAMN05216486_11031 [bacterium JGI 053]
MRRFLALLALALAAVLAHPPAARAQCNEACVTFVTTTGSVGHGCVVDNDSGAACYARSTKCYTRPCSNAMVTDPSGRMLAVADICNGNVTVHSHAHASKPRSAAKLGSRGTGTVAVARKPMAPNVG